MTTTAQTTTFTVSLGDTIENGGEDYGTFTAATAEDAVLAVLSDMDRTREYSAVEQLSHSRDFGRPADRVNGNGGQDRSGWWYVEADGRFVGVYVAHEVRP